MAAIPHPPAGGDGALICHPPQRAILAHGHPRGRLDGVTREADTPAVVSSGVDGGGERSVGVGVRAAAASAGRSRGKGPARQRPRRSVVQLPASHPQTLQTASVATDSASIVMSGARISRSHGAFGSSSSLAASSPDAAVAYSTVVTLPLGGLSVGSPGGGSSCVATPASSSTVVASSGASTPASVRGRHDKTTLAEFVFRFAAPPSAVVALSGNWNDWEPLPMAVMDETMGLALPSAAVAPPGLSAAPSPATSAGNLAAAGSSASAPLGGEDMPVDAAGLPAAAGCAADTPIFWAVVTRVPVGYVEFVFTVDGKVVVSPQHPVTHDAGANFRYIRGPSPGVSTHRQRRSSSVKGRARGAAASVMAAVSGGSGGGVGNGGGSGDGGGGGGVEGGRGGVGASDLSSPLASLVAVKSALSGWLADSPASDRDRDRTPSSGSHIGSNSSGGGSAKASPSRPLLPYGVGDLKGGPEGAGGGGTLESLATISRTKLLASAVAVYGVCHLLGRSLATSPRAVPLFS